MKELKEKNETININELFRSRSKNLINLRLIYLSPVAQATLLVAATNSFFNVPQESSPFFSLPRNENRFPATILPLLLPTRSFSPPSATWNDLTQIFHNADSNGYSNQKNAPSGFTAPTPWISRSYKFYKFS